MSGNERPSWADGSEAQSERIRLLERENARLREVLRELLRTAPRVLDPQHVEYLPPRGIEGYAAALAVAQDLVGVSQAIGRRLDAREGK